MILPSAGPGMVRTPFLILIDTAEKAPWDFSGIRARSFVDAEMREYVPQTERRYLGVGMGDYSLDGYQGRVGIERKSMADFQGTLLGWPVDVEAALAGSAAREIHRRGRFKRELSKLSAMERKAVVVEASLGVCLDSCPQWGKRTASENAKYLYATFLAWSQEFPVPWIFCEDRAMAAITAFRLLESFWYRTRKERTKQKRNRLAAERPSLFINPEPER